MNSTERGITRLFMVTVVLISALTISACSYIKSFFPDKEKDYHYSQEIPPLKMPPGLLPDAGDKQQTGHAEASLTDTQGQADALLLSSANTANVVQDVAATHAATGEPVEAGDPWDITLDDRVVPDMDEQLFEQQTTKVDATATQQALTATTAQAVPEAQQAVVTAESSPAPEIVEPNPAVKKTNKVRYVIFNDATNRIQIDANRDKSWRMVGKALSHNSIEITHRINQQDQYIVQYDANEKPYQDGTLWDEVLFFFGDDQNQEREYRVQLVAGTADLTEVLVVDEQATTAPESNNGQLLLQLLFKTIKADFQDD